MGERRLNPRLPRSKLAVLLRVVRREGRVGSPLISSLLNRCVSFRVEIRSDQTPPLEIARDSIQVHQVALSSDPFPRLPR